MRIPTNYMIPDASTEEPFKEILFSSFIVVTFNESRIAEYEK
jgi:hypothetical protein